MNRRTLLLATAAVAVFGLYFVDQGYRTWIEEPKRQYENRLEAIAGKMNDANRDQVSGRRLGKRLDQYAARALPYQADIARSRYQDWLLRLVEKHEMKSASVDADLPRPVEVRGRRNRRKSRLVGYRIAYALRTRTTLQRLTDFLHDFQHSAQLHKVVGFSLTPLVDGNQLDLSMEIETLTLEASERSETLSPLVLSDGSIPARETFTGFVERNLFARGFSRALAEVELTALTRNRQGEQEAWFRAGSPQRTQQVTAGDQLSIPLHQILVVDFETNGVRLEVNGLPCSIELGQSLADVFDVAEEPTFVAESPSDRNPSPGNTPQATEQETSAAETADESGT